MASSESVFDFLDAPAQPGHLGTLGHYDVIEELGRGGMGFVFRARDKRLHRDVALKVMNKKIASTPFSRRRFLHEARAMAAVHHDNVATIFEVGEKAGTPYMAMEMLEGSTLEGFNRQDRRLDYEQIIRYAEQIARGLAAAHAKGIVHRDIKPANIWIEPHSDRVKILDFGLALAATPVDQLAGRGAVIGTPGYLSPEQARTEPLDDRSDLYSLGVVLYELCTGKLPIDNRSVAGQLIAILAHRPRPLRELNPEIPQPLAELIHRLLCKEPRARISSANQLIDELQRVEQECHQQSEVAQTINKLQAGLSEVVNKKSGGLGSLGGTSFDDGLVAEPIEEVLDPFDTLPASPVAEVAMPAASPASRSGPMPAYRQPQTRSSGSSDSPDWIKYWPLLAVAAVVLLALPLMTFMFSSWGRSSEPVVISQTQPDGQSDGGMAGQNQSQYNDQSPSSDEPQHGEPAGGDAGSGEFDTAANADPGNRRQQGNVRQRGDVRQQTSANRPNQRADADRPNRDDQTSRGSGEQPGGDPNRGGSQSRQVEAVGMSAAADRAGGRDANGVSSYANGSRPPGSSSTPSDVPGGSGSPPPAARSDERLAASSDGSGSDRSRSATPPAATQAQQPQTPLRTVRIRTGEGRGADAMVQIGTSSKYGTKPSIGIHNRGEIESHHSYLRFDLSSIDEVQQEIKSAGLVLWLVGDERPPAAEIRLHGYAGEGVEVWQEEGPMALVWANTPSSVKLAPAPLLATTRLSESNGSADQVQITSDELAEFIRNQDGSTVTLILAGRSGRGSPLRFVSHEGDPQRAPTLFIKAPVEPSQPNRR